MSLHKVFKFYGEDGDVLVYIPSLSRLTIVTKQEAAELANEVEAEAQQGDAEIHTEKAFPPRFDVVDFHLTDKCNMSCAYCYAESNYHNQVLAVPLIERSLEYLFEHSDADDVRVHFLGGEPTMALDRLMHTVEYARKMAAHAKKSVHFTMTSNGVWNSECYDFVVNNFRKVNISFDGIREVHNSQRRLISGSESYDRVFETVSKLADEDAVALTTKSVVSSESVHRMLDTVKMLCDKFEGITIQFEPLHEIGPMVQKTGIKPPRIDDFLGEFLRCREWADEVESTNWVTTSYIRGLEYPLSTIFCGCTGDNFIVTTGGLVTACDEVTKTDGIGGDLFIFGRVTDEGVEFHEDKYRLLSNHDAAKSEVCRDCFALYACRGGCPLGKMLCSKGNCCKPNPHCKEILAWTERFLWYLAKLVRIHAQKQGL